MPRGFLHKINKIFKIYIYFLNNMCYTVLANKSGKAFESIQRGCLDEHDHCRQKMHAQRFF